MYNMNQAQAASLDELPSSETSELSTPVIIPPAFPEQLHEHPLPGAPESFPHVVTLPESQGKQNNILSPATSESTSSVFTLPESIEQLHEFGISEKSTPFSDTQSSGNATEHCVSKYLL